MFTGVLVVGMLVLLATELPQQRRRGSASRPAVVPPVHNAAQTWVWEDDEVVFEAACECGWRGPDRADQAEAVADALDHLR